MESPTFPQRICLALGALPSIISIYLRITMKETKYYELREKQGYLQTIKESWIVLVGTAGNWFLFDIVFFANGLYSSTVLEIMEIGGQDPTFSELKSIVGYNIYLCLIALPGFWIGIVMIETSGLGRKRTQMLGFFGIFNLPIFHLLYSIGLSFIYLLIASLYDYLKANKSIFIALYGISFSIANLGPNMTTFILAGESFPTEVRSTCHGLSAACGKLGALLGAMSMAPLLQDGGVPTVLFACSAISAFGLILTFLFTRETHHHELKT
jgi:PHS family inorganic phosphate transporter-like MFS transporter